jgi:hypothetical protein
MALLRVFVSSTCYDLSVLRNQLRAFIEAQGHEPVMSDYNDVLYDPRHHTHTSCIDEIVGCDVMVVIIGSRLGGVSIPEALDRVDIDALITSSTSIETLKKKENISITQLEVLKAIEESIPIFTFVDDRVWHDHATYEKNKTKSIIDQMEFSSIDKPKTARYIFEFINFLRHRSNNNGLTPFAKYSDIEESLSQQWSGFFKRLLKEQRQRGGDLRHIDALTEQFEDLKAAMLSTIGDDTRRKVARGVVKYRRLFDFLNAISQFAGPVKQYAQQDGWTWQKILDKLGVVDHAELKREVWRDLTENALAGPRITAVLQKSDETIFAMYYPLTLKDVEGDLDEFMSLTKDNREIILEALIEGQTNTRRLFAHTGLTLDALLKSLGSHPDKTLPSASNPAEVKPAGE